jgi:hypothetical protein
VLSRYVPLASVAPGLDLSPTLYVLRGLSATEDPRCPGGRAAVTAMSADALAAAVETAEPVTALRLWRCAWLYLPDSALPPPAWREGMGARAFTASAAAEASGARERALRHSALGTALRGQRAHDRRRTEALRARVFSKAQGS